MIITICIIIIVFATGELLMGLLENMGCMLTVVILIALPVLLAGLAVAAEDRLWSILGNL